MLCPSAVLAQHRVVVACTPMKRPPSRGERMSSQWLKMVLHPLLG